MEETAQYLRRTTLLRLDISTELSDEQVYEQIEQVILEYSKTHYLPLEERLLLKQQVFHSIRGFDVLDELLEDPSVTEIMVNGYQTIFYEKSGRLFLWEKQFDSEERLLDVIQKMAAKANRVVNESSPIADTRLPDGSRVNVVLPPASLDGPAVTIRKFSGCPITMERLVDSGSISAEARDYLIRAVKEKKNIFISGGTGSGKTTFLNALSSFIPDGERVVTIEDAAELQLRNVSNLVRLEVRRANAEGCAAISVRDLIRTALRMRPDRIIVGEVRGAEALDMLQAMNTGHSGSLSTGHANSTVDMISRLETMVLEGSEMPLFAIRKQIASAIDIFVHLSRRKDGSRGVEEISENAGLKEGELVLKRIYGYDKEKAAFFNCCEKTAAADTENCA